MLGGNTLEQRLNDQVFRHPLAHGIAGQFTIEQILQPSQVQLAFVSRNIGDVAHPRPVWRCHGEVPFQQVRCNWQVMFGIGGHFEFPFLLAT